MNTERISVKRRRLPRSTERSAGVRNKARGTTCLEPAVQTSACPPPLSSSTSLMVRGSSLGTLPLSCADTASEFGRRSESSIMNDDGSSVITERVCSRTKEHGPVDIESDGNADLNM